MKQLLAAIARCDITPPPGTPIFGYDFERLGHAVTDNLYATVLVLRASETAVCQISLDWLVRDGEETKLLRASIAAATASGESTDSPVCIK